MATNHRRSAGPGSSWGVDTEIHHGLELVRWHPSEPSYANWTERHPVPYTRSVIMMDEEHNYTEEQLRQYEERENERLNFLAGGAAWRGGHVNIDEKRMSEILKKRREEKERGEKATSFTEYKWMYVWNHSRGNYEAVKIMLDSGARTPGANFVTRQLVNTFGLKTEQVVPVLFNQISSSFECDEQVWLEWSLGPQDTSRVTSCYVLPTTCNVTMPLFGKDFIDSSGSSLLDDEPTNLIAYTAQRQLTEQERKQITAFRAQLIEDENIQREQRERIQKRSSEKEAKREKGDKGMKSLRFWR